MNDFKWKHVALILNGGYYRYYENGVQKALHARTTGNARWTDEWYVGYWGDWTGQFFGSMYDFYVNPSVALNQSQLTAYVAASAPQEPVRSLPSSLAPLPTGLHRLAYNASSSSFVNYGRHRDATITTTGGSIGASSLGDGAFELERTTTSGSEYPYVSLPTVSLRSDMDFTFMFWTNVPYEPTSLARGAIVNTNQAWIRFYWTMEGSRPYGWIRPMSVYPSGSTSGSGYTYANPSVSEAQGEPRYGTHWYHVAWVNRGGQLFTYWEGIEYAGPTWSSGYQYTGGLFLGKPDNEGYFGSLYDVYIDPTSALTKQQIQDHFRFGVPSSLSSPPPPVTLPLGKYAYDVRCGNQLGNDHSTWRFAGYLHVFENGVRDERYYKSLSTSDTTAWSGPSDTRDFSYVGVYLNDQPPRVYSIQGHTAYTWDRMWECGSGGYDSADDDPNAQWPQSGSKCIASDRTGTVQLIIEEATGNYQVTISRFENDRTSGNGYGRIPGTKTTSSMPWCGKIHYYMYNAATNEIRGTRFSDHNTYAAAYFRNEQSGGYESASVVVRSPPVPPSPPPSSLVPPAPPRPPPLPPLPTGSPVLAEGVYLFDVQSDMTDVSSRTYEAGKVYVHKGTMRVELYRASSAPSYAWYGMYPDKRLEFEYVRQMHHKGYPTYRSYYDTGSGVTWHAYVFEDVRECSLRLSIATPTSDPDAAWPDSATTPQCSGAEWTWQIIVKPDNEFTISYWDGDVNSLGGVRFGRHWVQGDGSLYTFGDGKSRIYNQYVPHVRAEVQPLEFTEWITRDATTQGTGTNQDRTAYAARYNASTGEFRRVGTDSGCASKPFFAVSKQVFRMGQDTVNITFKNSVEAWNDEPTVGIVIDERWRNDFYGTSGITDYFGGTTSVGDNWALTCWTRKSAKSSKVGSYQYRMIKESGSVASKFLYSPAQLRSVSLLGDANDFRIAFADAEGVEQWSCDWSNMGYNHDTYPQLFGYGTPVRFFVIANMCNAGGTPVDNTVVLEDVRISDLSAPSPPPPLPPPPAPPPPLDATWRIGWQPGTSCDVACGVEGGGTAGDACVPPASSSWPVATLSDFNSALVSSRAACDANASSFRYIFVQRTTNDLLELSYVQVMADVDGVPTPITESLPNGVDIFATQPKTCSLFQEERCCAVGGQEMDQVRVQNEGSVDMCASVCRKYTFCRGFEIASNGRCFLKVDDGTAGLVTEAVDGSSVWADGSGTGNIDSGLSSGCGAYDCWACPTLGTTDAVTTSGALYGSSANKGKYLLAHTINGLTNVRGVDELEHRFLTTAATDAWVEIDLGRTYSLRDIYHVIVAGRHVVDAYTSHVERFHDVRVSLSRQSRSHSDVVATHLNADQGNAVIFKGDKYDPGLLPVDRQTSGRRFVARPDFSASCVLPDCASLSSPAYADDGLTYNASSTCVASDGTPPACDSAAPSARHRMCRCTTPRDSPPPPPPPPPPLPRRTRRSASWTWRSTTRRPPRGRACTRTTTRPPACSSGTATPTAAAARRPPSTTSPGRSRRSSSAWTRRRSALSATRTRLTTSSLALCSTPRTSPACPSTEAATRRTRRTGRLACTMGRRYTSTTMHPIGAHTLSSPAPSKPPPIGERTALCASTAVRKGSDSPARTPPRPRGAAGRPPPSSECAPATTLASRCSTRRGTTTRRSA